MFLSLKNKISKLYLLLFCSIVILSVYTTYTVIKYNELSKVFQIEHLNLKKDIDKILEDYDELTINEDNILSNEIDKKRNSLTLLKRSLANLNIDSYSSLNTFRKKIHLISRSNRKLFRTIDSLKFFDDISINVSEFNPITTNGSIDEENEIIGNTVLATITPRVKYSGVQGRVIRCLKKPFLENCSLDVIRFEVQSLKKNKASNRYIASYKYDQVSAFKVSLEILDNEFVKMGKKNIYIQVIDEKNHIVRPLSFFNSNGHSILFTDCFTVNYSNGNLSVSFLSIFEHGTFKEGNYLFKVFIEGEYKCNKIITLS